MVALQRIDTQEQYEGLPIDTVIHGDCLEVLKTFPDNSVSAIVTDPPAGISFMLDKKSGRTWDSDKGGRTQWIAWLTEIMAECLRVIRPGGHALVWSLPRTSHWTGMALEDAGWEVRDVIYNLVSGDTKLMQFLNGLNDEQRNAFTQLLESQETRCVAHAFGSGFPKSIDISKQIDKLAPRQGMFDGFAQHFREQRQVSGLSQKQIAQHFPSKTGGMTGCVWNWENGANVPTLEQWHILQPMLQMRDEWTLLIERAEADREVIETKWRTPSNKPEFATQWGFGAKTNGEFDITAPATEAAKRYSGFGSALKPSVENWILVRKPLSEKNIAQNVLTWGCGGINIDATRVNGHSYTQEQWTQKEQARTTGNTYGEHKPSDTPVPSKRFPSNLLLSHDSRCIARGTKRVRANRWGKGNDRHGTDGTSIFFGEHAGNEGAGYEDEHGLEEVQAFECVENCPVKVLGEQSGERNSHGTAKRATYGGIFGNGKPVTGPIHEGDTGTAARYFQQFHDPLLEDERGQEIVQDFECVEGCPVKVLGEQAGESKSSARPNVVGKRYTANRTTFQSNIASHQSLHEDQGSKARYFQQFHDPLETLDAPFHYFSKSSRKDRNSGLEGMPTSASSRYGKMNGTSEHAPKYDTPEQNTHPTCKPTSLISWLCTLITPPGGIILDPFFGSGTLGVCAVRNGFHFIGIEQEQEYVNIARARIAHAQQEVGKRAESEGQEYICVDGCPIKAMNQQTGVKQGPWGTTKTLTEGQGNVFGSITRPDVEKTLALINAHVGESGYPSRYFTQLPPDESPEYDCVPECPIKVLDAQSGIRKSGIMKAGTRPKGHRTTFSQDVQGGYSIEHDTYGDTGGASRFFTQLSPEPVSLWHVREVAE